MGKVAVKANIEVEACKPPDNPKSSEHKSDFENIYVVLFLEIKQFVSFSES